jgi:hypothetical protein
LHLVKRPNAAGKTPRGAEKTGPRQGVSFVPLPLAKLLFKLLVNLIQNRYQVIEKSLFLCPKWNCPTT